MSLFIHHLQVDRVFGGQSGVLADWMSCLLCVVYVCQWFDAISELYTMAGARCQKELSDGELSDDDLDTSICKTCNL